MVWIWVGRATSGTCTTPIQKERPMIRKNLVTLHRGFPSWTQVERKRCWAFTHWIHLSTTARLMESQARPAPRQMLSTGSMTSSTCTRTTRTWEISFSCTSPCPSSWIWPIPTKFQVTSTRQSVAMPSTQVYSRPPSSLRRSSGWTQATMLIMISVADITPKWCCRTLVSLAMAERETCPEVSDPSDWHLGAISLSMASHISLRAKLDKRAQRCWSTRLRTLVSHFRRSAVWTHSQPCLSQSCTPNSHSE